jgi:hypothetical protein
LGLALAACLATPGSPARAQVSPVLPKPWRPAASDSIADWASQARSLLAGSKTDDLGEREVVAYRYIDRIAKSYFHALGPQGMVGGGGVVTFLDSLRLQGKFTQDPEYPAFAFVQYFNPSHEGFASLGYLYWFRGSEIRSQPVHLKDGHDPQFRVWWSGREAAPWETALIYDVGRAGAGEPELIFMRMVATGAGWEPVQAGVGSIDLGGKGTARFADLDRDGIPEIISWVAGVQDSLFVPCHDVGCPDLITERTFVLERGYELYDQRTVATPFAAFVLFVRALTSGQTALAQSLVTAPAVLAKARELGFTRFHQPGVFRATPPRGGTRWPDRLRFEYGPRGVFDTFLEVRFASQQGHWLIDEIVVLKSGAAPADSSSRSRTGTPASRPKASSRGTSRGAR